MKPLPAGTKLVIGDRTVTVESKPAKASGLQTIHYDGIEGIFGFEWRDWKDLTKFPRAEGILLWHADAC